MKKILVTLFFVILLSFSITNVDALRQAAGQIIVDLKPGQSEKFEWVLVSDNPNEVTSIKLSVEGDGSEFLLFPETIELNPRVMRSIEVTVSVPDDFPGDITLTPHLLATEFGEEGGATIINIRMLKIITLNIAPNDDPSLWVDWDEINKSEPESETAAEQVTKQESGPEGFSIIQPEGESESDQEPVCGAGTHEENGICVPDKSGGGCLIATATFGSELAPQVQFLREIRDDKVLKTESGASFMAGFNQFYYSFSPTIADLERQSPIFKETVKIAITPLLTSLSILNYVDIDSEEEVLGYGVGLILMNIGMYFVAPAIVISKIFSLRKN